MEDNNTNPITPQEFAKKIKSKYPQYKDIDDVTLTNKMIEKYPEYASQVSLKKKESSQPTSQESLWGSNSQPKDVYTSLVTDQRKPRQASVTSDGEQPKMRTLGVDITKEEALKKAPKKMPVIDKSIQKKIKNAEFKPKEYRDLGSRLVDKLAKGSSQLGADIAAVPEIIYDVAAAPQNAIADIFNIPSLKTDSEEFKKQLNTANTVKDYYQKQVIDLSEKSKELDRQYSQDIFDSFSKGDYVSGFEQLTNGFLESLPTTAAIMVGGAYAKAPQILATSTMIFGAGKSEQLKKENPELSTNARVANSLATGFAQAATETLGSASIGSAAKALVSREGEKKAITILKDGLSEYYKTALKRSPLTASAIGEGVEEWSSKIAENAIDVATGIKPEDYNIFEGGSDALLSGVFGGAVFGVGLTGIKNTVNAKDQKIIKENNKKIFDLQSQLENQTISPEIKQEINSKITKLIVENEKYVKDDISKIESLPTEVKDKLISSTNKLDELKAKAKEINDSNEITIETKSILLEDLKKQAIQNTELKNSILDGTYVENRNLDSENKNQEQKTEEVAPVETTEVVAETEGKDLTTQYIESIDKVKSESPETFWSVDKPFQNEDGTIDEVQLKKAEEEGRLIKTEAGFGVVSEEGDIKGVFKSDLESSEKTGDKVIQEAVKAGGIKLDNFALPNLMKIYQRNGFRVTSRTPFNEEFAPEGWNKEKDGTPDVVAMVYDPNNELDIEEKVFDNPETGYDEAMTYRDSFVDQARNLTTEVNNVQEVIDESEKSNDLPSLVQKAKTALSQILPEVDVILHDTDAEYEAAVGESVSSGAFINNTVHINANKANGRTVAHEVFHAVLLNKVKSDPEAQRITSEMITAIEKVLPPDMKAKLQDFVESGYDAQKELWNEEKLAELVGFLAENYDTLPQPTQNIIKQWLDQLAKLVGIKEFTDKEVVDFMNTLSGKVASGEVITEKDVKILSGGKKISNPFDYFKRKQVGAFDVQYTEQDKLDKLIKDKLVTKPENLDFLSGKETSITSPDDMLAGTISIDGKKIFEGGGGVFFVTKYGDVWASGNKGTANTLARSINNSYKKNGDKGYLVLAKGSDSKLISSASGVNSSLAVLDSMIDKGLISPSDFRSAVSESIKRFGGNISLRGSAKQLKEDVNNYFSDPKSSTFEVRGSVLGSIINSLAQSKNTKANKDQIIEFLGGDKNKGLVALTTKENKNKNQSLSDLISGVAAEQLTKGLNVGDVYAVIEVDGEVTVKEDSHPSYPFHVVPVGDSKPVLHLPMNRQNGSELLTTSTGKPYKVGQVSIMSGSFNGPSRKQIIGEKAVKDKLVQNNLDTAKEMEAANKSAEDIFIATGWEKGADNKWKYDLQEGVVEFKNKKNGKASDVINYPELFKAYPKAKDINIAFMNSDKFDGMYLPSKNRIMLSNSLSDSELKSTLLHEIQHFIQNEEGFAVGGNTQTIKDLYNARIKYEKNFSVKKVLNNIKNSLFKPNPESVKEDLDKLSKLVSKSDEELYKSIAGEVEAFNVEKRAKMTPEERKASPISKTADKPKEEQVVISESDTMLKDRKQTNRPSVNKIYEQSEQAIKDRNKKKSIKDLGPYLRKSLLDRQAYIKRLLDRIENKSAKKAYDLLVTKAGASALAAERFKQAEKEIYGKLNSEDTKTLDKIIYARRIVAVNESRAELGMPPYKGMDGYSLEDAKQDLADFKQELRDKKFNDLNDRATTYFNVFKANLRKLYDSGRISKEVYESLRNTEYSPIKTIKYIIGDNLSPDEIDTQAKSLGISRNDIMKLSDANENEIILDSKWLLAMNIGSVEGRAFENRMLSEFNKAIESATADEKKAFEEFVLDNPVVGKKKDGGPKYKYDDTKVPVGYSKVSYFENGNKREIVLKDIYAKQLLDVKNKDRRLEKIGKYTGSQILRFFATGGNPLFIIGNTAVDFQNIAFWSDTYSKFKPVAAVQLMRDFTKNFIKKAVLSNKYNAIFNEYINHGGALDYLSNDGLKALESMNPVKTVTKQVQKGLIAYGRAMSFLGETSEVAFRLSVFEKVKEDSIKEFKKENGREPNFQEKEDILWKAGRESRETMDFSQGGDVAKNIDAVFPYFNAALQGVRRPIDFAMKNPVGFASSVLQYTAMAGSLTAASLAMLIKSVRDDEEDDDKANKKILEALNSISEYEKANYHVLFTGNKNKDGEYEYYRIKKLPVLSVISTVGDQLIYNDFFKNVGIDYKIDKEAIQEAAVKSNPLPMTIQELAGKNPAVSGAVSYWSNKDTFTGEKIFREPNNKKILPEAEGIFDDKVDQIYKDLAPKFGLSPIKTQVMIEKVITSSNTNPTIPLIYSAYDGIFNKKDGLGNEASEAMSNVGKAFGKKLVRYTDKNIIRYKKQDEMEYNESVIETDVWKKEQKVYNEIKGAYKDGGSLTEKEFVDVIKKNFDPIDQPKYAKKYFAYINNMNVDKSVLDIIFEDVPEVQAMKLNQRYGSNLEETEIKELEEAMRSSRRKVNKKALYIYNEKYKNRKPAN